MTIENIKNLGFTNWQHLNIFYIRNTIYNFGQLQARIQKISWAMRFIILLTFICCSASAINVDSLSAFRFHYFNFDNKTNIFKWFCCQLHFSGIGKILIVSTLKSVISLFYPFDRLKELMETDSLTLLKFIQVLKCILSHFKGRGSTQFCQIPKK